VVSPNVGDVVPMLSDANRPFIAPAGMRQALRPIWPVWPGRVLAQIGGRRDRTLATEYDEKTMVDRYRALYARAMGLSRFP
jgi:hypothetical protein